MDSTIRRESPAHFTRTVEGSSTSERAPCCPALGPAPAADRHVPAPSVNRIRLRAERFRSRHDRDCTERAPEGLVTNGASTAPTTRLPGVGKSVPDHASGGISGFAHHGRSPEGPAHVRARDAWDHTEPAQRPRTPPGPGPAMVRDRWSDEALSHAVRYVGHGTRETGVRPPVARTLSG